MAYEILAKDGRPIMKDGVAVKAMDLVVEKIEQLDEGNKSFIAVASTEDEDRDKDIIRQDGWDLKNFKKNPMIPWSHNYWGIPIAKSLKTWVDKVSKKLMFKPQFDEDDDESMKIFNKYRKGFLKSFSVGFKGLKFEYRNEDDPWWGGIEFLQQELLEISGVTVPANPNATVSLHGVDDLGRNLLQLGYPVKFAKTDSGLFYPIREELGEFVNPEIKDLEKGIQCVSANIISELKEDGSGGEAVPVGYYFDPEKWSTDQIKSWINGLSDRTYKFHYYNWEWSDDEEKDFQVELKEEEKEIPNFDDFKVLTTEDVPGHNKDDESLDDELSDDESLDDNVTVNDTEKLLMDHLEKMTDLFGKHLDAITKGVGDAFEKVLDVLVEVKSLLNEKLVDSDFQIDDNKSNDNLAPDEDNDKNNSKTNDDIELDDSLLTPDNDKTNDDDMIELDDSVLSDKGNAKAVVNSVFKEKLEETLKEVKNSFKIEV